MAAARVRTNRFLLNWGWVQPTKGSYRWGADGPRSSAGLPRSGIRAVPSVWGNPDWVAGLGARLPRSAAPPAEQAWRDFLKALVARYGPGGTYWATAYRQQFGAERHAAADPVLADLERAQPEEVLRARRPRRGKYARLLQISHDAIKSRDPEGPDRARRDARQRGRDRLGLPQQPLRGVRDQEQLRRRRPAPVRAHPRPAQRRRSSRFRTVMTNHARRGHAAVDHRDRLGLGASRQLRHQQGPHGSSADAHQRLQDDPATTDAPGTSSASSGTTGATRPSTLKRDVQLLRQRGAAETTTAPRSPPTARSGASRPRRPRPWRASPRGQPREASPTTRPRPSPLPRTSPARPSSAGSTAGPFKPCTSPLHRPRRSRTAPTPSSSRRSTPPGTRARSCRGPSPSTPAPRRRRRSPTPTPTRRPTTTPPR